MERYKYIPKQEQFINRTVEDFVAFTAKYYGKGVFTAMSEQEKGYAVDKEKVYPTHSTEEKETEHLSASGTPKKEIPPELRDVMAIANLGVSNDPDDVLAGQALARLIQENSRLKQGGKSTKDSREQYRPLAIEKSIPAREERGGTQFGFTKEIISSPSKEKEEAIASSEGPAEEVALADLPPRDPELRSENLTVPENKPVFADERAKIAWEIGQAIERLAPIIGPEDVYLKLKAISFDREHATKGHYAILMSGTVVGTGREGVLEVPERTLSILKKLGIPYRFEVDTR